MCTDFAPSSHMFSRPKIRDSTRARSHLSNVFEQHSGIEKKRQSCAPLALALFDELGIKGFANLPIQRLSLCNGRLSVPAERNQSILQDREDLFVHAAMVRLKMVSFWLRNGILRVWYVDFPSQEGHLPTQPLPL